MGTTDNTLDMVTRQKNLVTSLQNIVPHVNPFLYWTDSYKDSHILFEIEGTKRIYSNLTIRFDKYLAETLGDHYDHTYVAFGLQWVIARLHMMAENGFFKRPWDEVKEEMLAVNVPYIGNSKIDQFEALHKLGYLPILVKGLPEGTVAPVGTPMYTIENTLPEFEWLTNFLESGMSADTWKQLTVATVARVFRTITNQFAMDTQGTLDGTEFQNHDFHVRGASGFESAAINGVAFLLSSSGTDNKPSLWAARDFYFTKPSADYLLAGSVPAGEHSVTTLGILTTQRRAAEEGEEIDLVEAERRYTRWIMTERFPTGIVSFVADSFNYFKFIEEIVPSLYEEIMARDGKFVVRGDSGNPVHIIAGYRILDLDQNATIRGRFQTFAQVKINTHLWWKDGTEVVKFKNEYWRLNAKYFENGGLDVMNEELISRTEAIGTIQSLWDTFGGTVNGLGYKHLDEHIGMIYGDGITVSRSIDILTRLKENGFASTNIVYGIGSYSLNMLSRDHLGIAIKATNALVEIGGEDVDAPIYKEPATDTSKKSARGYLVVDRDENGNIITKDMQTREAMLNTGMLGTVYKDGYFQVLDDVKTIRERLWPVQEAEEDTSVGEPVPEAGEEGEAE